MTNRKRTLFSLVVPAAMLVLLAGCGGTTGSSNNNGASVGNPSTSSEYLVVANSGGGISSFAIDTNSGALTAVSGSPFSTSANPKRLAVDPSGKAIYATEDSGGTNLQSFTIDSSGSLSSSATSSYAGNPGDIAVDPSGKHAYVIPDTTTQTMTVSAFSIDPSSHGLTPLPGQPTGVAGVPRFITVDPSGKYVYMSIVGTTNSLGEIAGRGIDQTNGTLSVLPSSPFILSGTDPRQLTITSNNIMFVTNFNSNNLSILSLDPATGSLGAAPGSPIGTGTGPVAVATDSAGKFAFVVNQGASTISVFSISGTTLTPVSGSPFPTGGTPNGVAVDTSDKFLYVTNSTGPASAGSIAAFTIASDGSLAPIAGSPFTAGNGAQSPVVAKP